MILHISLWYIYRRHGSNELMDISKPTPIKLLEVCGCSAKRHSSLSSAPILFPSQVTDYSLEIQFMVPFFCRLNLF